MPTYVGQAQNQTHCAALCGSAYQYIGLEYWGECRCSNDYTQATQHGVNTDGCSPLGGSCCIFLIQVRHPDGSSLCDENSVPPSVPLPSIPPPISPPPACWSVLGSFDDRGSNRAMPVILSEAVETLNECATLCFANGYALMGLEYYGQCHCGNNETRATIHGPAAEDCGPLGVTWCIYLVRISCLPPT